MSNQVKQLTLSAFFLALGLVLPFADVYKRQLCILSESEIDILIDMKQGSAQATAWGCDLTYDYVKINGDYRT